MNGLARAGSDVPVQQVTILHGIEEERGRIDGKAEKHWQRAAGGSSQIRQRAPATPTEFPPVLENQPKQCYGHQWRVQPARRSTEERIALEARLAFRVVDVDVVCARAGNERPALFELLDGLVRSLQELSDALSGSYLAPATISRALAAPGSSL